MELNQEHLRDDEQARVQALDITRSYIVQAPAGSGKTELLIQRYLKLLAIVEHPEEILAITFTRKAAAEMQLRVVQALRNAAEGIEPTEEHERVTAAAATAALERDGQKSWDLIANARRMRIQTLDSLNASIARTQPVTATGGAAGNAILADAEMRALYRSAAALTLDQLAEEGDLHQATEEVLVHVDTNTSIYIAYLARMLATRDQWLPIVGSGLLQETEASALRSQFENSLEHLITAHLQRLQALMTTGMESRLIESANYAGCQLHAAGQTANPISVLDAIEELPGADPSVLSAWMGLADLLLTQQGGWRKRANKNQGFPPGDDGQKAAFHALLEDLAAFDELRECLHDVRILPPATYGDEQWSVLIALFRLLPLAVTELKRLFAERGATDHIEVALSASTALGSADNPGDVTMLLDYQVRHLLVDEMQDTSSAQYRMIEALTGGWEPGDGRTLYCVGDPMQSIYRFRNAEVGQFLLAKTAGIGDVQLSPLTLRRNFRSGESLVDWFNRVFAMVLPERDDSQSSAVSYSPSVAVPKLAGQGVCSIHPVIGADKESEAVVGLQVLQDLRINNPDDDIAILVRGRTHLPELLRLMRDADIDYRAVDIDRLTDLPEIIDILALTRAVVHRGDRLAWLALLRSPWAGLDWSDLHALVVNDASSTLWEILNDAEKLGALSELGRSAALAVRDALEPAISSGRVATLRDTIEQTWMKLGGPALLDDSQAIENVYRFLDVVEKIETAGTLADVADLENILDQEHVSSDVVAQVQVMTMHRAKGLQFDHVVLFGLGRVPRSRDPEFMSWFDIPDAHGRTHKVISPVGARAMLEKDPLHSFIANGEAKKDRNELARLLYVACTRARKSLQLVGHAQPLKTGLRPDKRSLLHLLWPSVCKQFDAVLESTTESVGADRSERWAIPQLRRFASPWSMPDPAELPVDPPSDIESNSGQSVEFYWVGAAARLAGTLVHRWLQLATDGRIDLKNDLQHSLRAAGRRWLTEQGVAGADIGPINARVEAALRGVLADEKGRWLIEGDGYAELALSGIVNSRIESVLLDRVRIDNGVHWVVDYKTSSHEGGNLSGFLAAESDRYRPQLAKYAKLYGGYAQTDVRCALYFPLLQEFVEVQV